MLKNVDENTAEESPKDTITKEVFEMTSYHIKEILVLDMEQVRDAHDLN